MGTTVIGTKTGKVKHLSRDSHGITGYTWCGKWIRNYQDKAGVANCQKCIDTHDLEKGQAGHSFTLVDHRDGAVWTGSTGSCSCGRWSTTVAVEEATGRVGLHLVDLWHDHVRAEYRAGR